MNTARRESCLACNTRWRSDVCVDPESRDANHETRLLGFTVRQTFLLDRTSPPPMVFTNHETPNTAIPETPNTAFTAVRFPVGAQGAKNKMTRNRHLDRRAHLRVTASLPTTSPHFPPFPGKKFTPEPVSAHRPPFSAGLAPIAAVPGALRTAAATAIAR